MIGVSFFLVGMGFAMTKTRPFARALQVVRPPGLPTIRSDAPMYSSILFSSLRKLGPACHIEFKLLVQFLLLGEKFVDLSGVAGGE